MLRQGAWSILRDLIGSVSFIINWTVVASDDNVVKELIVKKIRQVRFVVSSNLAFLAMSGNRVTEIGVSLGGAIQISDGQVYIRVESNSTDN